MFDYFTLNNLIQFIKILSNIAIVWMAFYFVLKIVKNNSRTIQIFKGILLIFLIKSVANLLGLNAVEYLADLFIQHGPIAIIIIFQPEFRALLEKIGKTNVFSRISTLTLNERERLVDELVKACAEMSKTKTGALISLEQGHSLSDFIKTGTPMNSVVTSELLCSIFVPGTPLHDGAVILQGVKIACAAAYFPPTTQDLPTMYGARHRAAVGISEITDSITIIVSEETGNISIAEGGKLSVVSEKSLREFLTMVICQTQTEVVKEKIRKDSDSEKDIDVLEKERIEAKSKGKRKSLFRGKSQSEKSAPEKKRFYKKPQPMTKEKREAIIDQQVEKIGIANLVEESMPLDNLFDSIVADSDHKRNEEEKASSSVLSQIKEESAQSKPSRAARSKRSEAKVQNDPDVLQAQSEPINPTFKLRSRKQKPQDSVSTDSDLNQRNTPIKREIETMPAVIEDKPVVKRAHEKQRDRSADEAALLDDVISPEAIVLNYKEEKQKKTRRTRNASPDEDSNEGRFR